MQSLFWFILLSYCLFNFYESVAADEVGVLGEVDHRLVIIGIGIEVFDHCVGVTLSERLDLILSEAEVDELHAAQVGGGGYIILDIQPLAYLLEHNVDTGGEDNVVIPALSEIEGLYLAAVVIPELGNVGVDILDAPAIILNHARVILKRLLERHLAGLVLKHRSQTPGDLCEQLRILLEIIKKEIHAGFASVDSIIKIVNIHFNLLLFIFCPALLPFLNGSPSVKYYTITQLNCFSLSE